MRPDRTLTPEEHVRKAQELMAYAAVSSDAYAEATAHASLASALYAQQAAGTARGRRRPLPPAAGTTVPR